MESAVRHQYDATLALQALGSAAITATTATAAVDIYQITKSPYDAVAGRYGTGSFDVVVYVKALDHTTGDETYSLVLQTVDAAGANPVDQESITIDTTAQGQVLVFALHPSTLHAKDADAAKVRINAVLGGTSPSLQYWAFVAPHSHY